MIRLVKPADHPAIAAIVEPAFVAEFGSSTENALITQLREGGDVVFEMVAVDEAGEIVGHILYSRLWVASPQLYAALAPMAVRNDLQKSGIGSALIRASFDTAREFGHNIRIFKQATRVVRRGRNATARVRFTVGSRLIRRIFQVSVDELLVV